MSQRLAFPAVLSTAAAILILAAGCADQTPTAVQLEPVAVSAVSAVGQAANVVKAEGKYEAGTYSQVIGRDGGTLDFGIGKIEFPAGAVAHATRITASVDGENLAVKFGPHGLEFPEGAEPRLVFSSGSKGDYVIAYVNNADVVLEVIPTTQTSSEAWGLIAHYSKYVLLNP